MLKFIKQHAAYFVSGLFLLALFALSLNIYGNPATFRKLIGVSGIWFAFYCFALILIFRLLFSAKSFLWIQKLNTITIPITILTASAIIITEYVIADNYVYSILRLNPHILLVIGHISLIYLLLFKNQSFYQKFGKFLLIIAPFWFTALSALVWMLPLDKFVDYRTEDGLVENFQFILLLTTSIFALIEAYLSSNKKSAFRFLILGLFFLVVALEEISWGQRIFGIETPEKLKEVNVQYETTIHNIGIFNFLQLVAYALISFFGSIIPLFQIFRKIKWAPPKIAPIYFLLPLIFYTFGLLIDKRFFPDWSEIVEVFFYSGLLIWIASHTPNTLKKINSKIQ